MEDVIYHFLLPDYLDLWNKAEKLNDPKAQFKLAQMYAKSPDPSMVLKAVDLYKKSAKLGNADAELALGICYEMGVGVRRSYVQAIRWYKRVGGAVQRDLTDNPDPKGEAAKIIVDRYFEDEEFASAVDAWFDSQQREDSFEADRAAAMQGDAQAQNSLGHRYYFGRGIEQNYEQAFYWYKKSAEQGYEAGVLHLAQLCERNKQYKEAAKWYHKYAEIQIQFRNERLGW